MAIWHNSVLSERASVDASSAGITLGWGVFTTLGVRGGRTQWLAKHLARIRRDAARCGVEIPYSDEELSGALQATLRANEVKNGVARITVSRRDDGRWNTISGSDVTVMALEAPLPKTLGLHVCFAPAPDGGALRGVKTTSYLPYLWEWQRAVNAGYDEVVLCDANGRVVEAARSSLFWWRDGRLETSPLASGALDGVGREIVLEWARESGVPAREAELQREDLRACEELFLVSAATGPRSISMVEGQEMPREAWGFEALHAWWDAQ